MKYLYETPIEMPRGMHYGSDYWIVYSYKLKRIVHLFSMLEYANFLTLEMNPEVEYFCEQPLKISDKEQKKSSVFDFWVQYNDSSSEFQEVKYSSELTGDTDAAIRSQKQIELQNNWCLKNNCGYKVITENELFVGEFTIQNLGLLYSHLLRYSLSENNNTNKLYELLKDSSLLLKDIISLNITKTGQEFAMIAYLYYSGKVTINLGDRPLDNLSEVTFI